MEKEQSQQQPKPRLCPKDCRQCGMAQQMYCSAQLSFTAYEVMGKILERIEKVENTIKSLDFGEKAFKSPITHEKVSSGTTIPQDKESALESE